MIARSQSGIVKPIDRLSLHTSSISPIPNNLFHALKDPNWHNAMHDEYNALVKNGTWLLVPRPAGVNMPPGFVDNRYPHHVCLLQRSLYGLKQAPRAWFQQFTGYAIRAGFYHSRCDCSLFIYRQGSQVAYLLIYVGDIILTASCVALLQQIIGCSSTRRSTSGYCVFPGDNLLSWSAKRQHTISRSSAEAEYRGVANVVVETAWVRNLLRELHSPLMIATLVYYDNVIAVYMSANPVQHQRTKHIKIDIHFVCDMVTAGHVRIVHVPSRFQFADIYTKGLPSALFEDFRSSLSVRLPPTPTVGGVLVNIINVIY
uniref:NBS-containing resistance-like protein n=1 Tax=Tanacetum cinerariifolium TaxID=118510 RepID=A0A6L2JJS0_TANCI|nr:NBS-containing resistance-like protein [Tanacetum cinerariifolium]